nr:MAG TPA: hypothetical protein [Caudoviricetes sp.]
MPEPRTELFQKDSEWRSIPCLRTFRGRLESFEDFSAKNNTQKEYTQYTGVQRPYFFDHFF